MWHKKIILFFTLGIMLPQCKSINTAKDNEENKISISILCKSDLPEKEKFLHVLNESANTSSVKLGRVLFDYSNENLARKTEFNEVDLKNIQNYYNLLIKDISKIFFNEEDKGINLEIKESLNPSTSCRTNKLRVTPYFLQILFEESLKESINRNTIFFNNENKIKSLEDYFDLLIFRPNEKEVNSLDDESIALEFQRTNVFISYEFMKAFTFIFGHELCHFLTKCELGHQFEYDSDLLGVLAYQFMNHLIYYDYRGIAECYIGNEFEKVVSAKDSSQIVGLILGRDLPQIVEDIYKETDFEKESVTHPPLGTRIKIIEELINRGNPDEIYFKLQKKKILKFTSHEESIYHKFSSGGDFIYNANWLFPASDN